MLNTMRDALKKQDYVFLGLEVIVVIFSILVAFQMDRWAENRRERKQEQNYLVRLKEDLQIEIAAQLASRPDAVALIPSIVQHHVFNLRAIGQTRISALNIIGQIDQLLAGS